MVKHVAEAWPAAPLLGAGWGIGANILLCYLGEEGDAAPLRAAISLANLFDLPAVDNNLKDGFHRFPHLNPLPFTSARSAPLFTAESNPSHAKLVITDLQA